MERLYKKECPSIKALQWSGDNYVEVANFIIDNMEEPVKYFTHNDKTIIVNLYNGQALIINCGNFIFKKESNVLIMSENMFKKKYKIESIEYIVKENV